MAVFFHHRGECRLFREEVDPLLAPGSDSAALCQEAGMRKGGQDALFDSGVSIRGPEAQRRIPLVSVGRSILPCALGVGLALIRGRATHERCCMPETARAEWR